MIPSGSNDIVGDRSPHDARAWILVVDNESDIAEFVRRAVVATGLEIDVVYAHDAAAAMALTEPDPPALALVAARLCRTSGLDLTEALKGDPRTAAVPVVMTTSSDEPQLSQRASLAGANSLLRLPVENAQLMALLARALRYWITAHDQPQAARS